tara:strand:+ start:177 stop:1124 length:948 start_codon:yes stop_codon:yes gene_type:complete
MFRSVKSTISYYFGANNDEEDTPLTCDKSTQTDDVEMQSVETKSVETQSIELFVPLTNTTATNTDTKSSDTNSKIEVNSLLQQILEEVDKSDEPSSSLQNNQSSSSSAFTDDSDEDEPCMPIDLRQYNKSKPCPLSHKKEELKKIENKISPTYSQTLAYAKKKAEQQDKQQTKQQTNKKFNLFNLSVEGSSHVTDIKINPDMLKLLEAKKEEEQEQNDSEEDEEEYVNNQRKQMKIKHQVKHNASKKIIRHAQSTPNLKIKLPIYTKISPRKIPPNAPRAQDSPKKTMTIEESLSSNDEYKGYSLRQRKPKTYKY